jgi:hypothetical protein
MNLLFSLLQINTLDRVENKPAKFARHRNDLNWKTLLQRRKIARICALFKAYTGERAQRILVVDYKGHAIWAEPIMTRKLGAESKGQISENIPS